MSERKMPFDQIIQNCEEKQKKKLFHGSKNIIRHPQHGVGSLKNDFGRGFYCTEKDFLAKEWAMPDIDRIGYCNEYQFDIKGLKVLNLHDPQYHLLNWAALLFKYRDFTPPSYDAKENMKYFVENFCVDIKGFDVIIGYRADDSYFTWAKEFIDDRISYEQLERTMKYGNLGDQIVLVSPKAFDRLEFVSAIEVDKEYFYLRCKRNEKANNRYFREKMEIPKNKYDLTASDIREGEFKNEDFRISRNLQGNRGR